MMQVVHQHRDKLGADLLELDGEVSVLDDELSLGLLQVRPLLVDNQRQKLVLQTTLSDGEVDEGCLSLDLRRVVRVAELGVQNELEVLVVLNILVTKLHIQAAPLHMVPWRCHYLKALADPGSSQRQHFDATTDTALLQEESRCSLRDGQHVRHPVYEAYLLECGAGYDWVEDSVNILAHVLNEYRVSSLHGPLHGSDSGGGAHAHHLQVVAALPLLDPHYALKSEPHPSQAGNGPRHISDHCLVMPYCIAVIYDRSVHLMYSF